MKCLPCSRLQFTSSSFLATRKLRPRVTALSSHKTSAAEPGENAISQCLSQRPGCHLFLLPTSPNSCPSLSSSLVAFRPHWLSCYLSNTPHPFPPQSRCTCSLYPKGLASGFHGLELVSDLGSPVLFSETPSLTISSNDTSSKPVLLP